MKVFKFFFYRFTDYILWKKGVVFKGGHYKREDIIQGNMVCMYYVVVVMPLYRFDYTHIPIPAVGH